MRVLVACEFSGIVRDAFRACGHDAWSCDLLPSERGPEYHIRGDVLNYVDLEWDLLIAHPPCTYLANSGVRWLYTGEVIEGVRTQDAERWEQMREGAEFFSALLAAPVKRVAVENPIMHRYAREIIDAHKIIYQRQTIQPWQYGHPETKATQLWLRNLPELVPTNDVRAEMVGKPKRETDRVHYASPGPQRWAERSRTLTGIAAAMAEQWGAL